MNTRIAKVNELIKQEIGKLILSDVNFPKGVLVTVIKTKTSADLHYADVFISVLPADKAVESKEILDKNIYFLQQKINKKLCMKPVPKIRFEIDRTGEYVERIDKLIEKLKN